MWLYMKRVFRLRRAKVYLAVVFTVAVACHLLTGRGGGGGGGALGAADEQARLRDSILEELGVGCEAPRFDPFSEETIRDDYDKPKVRCEGNDWVRCHISECFVIEEVLKRMSVLFCIYKDILYINDYQYVLGDPVRRVNNETYTLRYSDIVKVSCTGMEVGAIIPIVWVGHKIGLRKLEVTRSQDIDNSQLPLDPCKRLNVVMLCFHSASRNRFTRRMPKSLKVLTEELNATFFNIHSIVGDGEAAALFPLLTGKSETEFANCRKKISKGYIDVKSLLFYVAKINGFQTAFLEDVEYEGTFQNKFNGFSRQPADHYLRAFHLEAIHNSNWLTSFKHRHCIGSTPLYKKILELTQYFAKLEREYFSLSSIGQIYNDPYNLVPTVDDDVSAFLRGLKITGALQNTLLMVLGDHGPKFGRFRETYQGKLEERLPMLALVLPKKFESCRPSIASIVKANSKLLTTPFDVHATALDAMGLFEYTNTFAVRGATTPRAMSLLRPMPSNRTCGEAGVLPHWCVCAKWLDVPDRDPIHANIGNCLVEFINNLTLPARNVCIEQTLSSIVWVMRQSVKEAVLKNDLVGDIARDYRSIEDDLMRPSKEYYQAKIVLSPSEAVFEGTVSHSAGGDGVVADVSRVSAYGEEAGCVADTRPDLIKYCHCMKKHEYLFSYKTIKII